MEDKSLNTNLEIAVEILATKIAISSDEEEIQRLMNERNEMYIGNEKVIEKIIEQYGPEVKKYYTEK